MNSFASYARDISLLETRAEFVHRFRQRQQQSASGLPVGATTITALATTTTTTTTTATTATAEPELLPLLTSACPGWICYAEKTHGDFVLPYISAVRSPQQVMGEFPRFISPVIMILFFIMHVIFLMSVHIYMYIYIYIYI